MRQVRFIHNLKPDAVQAAMSGMSEPSAFLIAPNNARGQALELTHYVRDHGFDLLVDNGNFALLGPLTRPFLIEAKTLKSKIDSLEEVQGHTVRRGEMPPDLVLAYQDLAQRVRQAAREAVPADGELFAAQLALRPTGVIGVEDLTMAAWLRLDLEPRYLGLKRSVYRRYNASVARRARRAEANMPPTLAAAHYPVASAMSFNTAKDAGREFAPLPGVSMGFGAYMADNNYSDHFYRNRMRIDFNGNYPQRYTRTVAAAAGFWEGYEEIAGTAPARFHFLGVGTPIMIAVLTLAAARTPDISFDATSPILDATQGGTIYSDKPAHLKLRTRKIALNLARDPNLRWDCPCPFCTGFIATAPFHYDDAHRWLTRTAATDVTTADLQPGGGLYQAFPLFSEPAGGEQRRAVNFARVGHNHWIIDRLMTTLNRAADDNRLQTCVTNIVRDYQRNTTDTFAEALELSLRLALGQQ